MENDNTWVTMTLQPVGVAKEDVTLSKIVPMNGENGWSYSSDNLATVKNTGVVDKKFGYVSPYWAELAEDATVEGWHLYSNLEDSEFYGERCDNVKIPFGTGLSIYTSASGVTVQFAGEVLMDDYGIPLSENANTFTGVVCPKDITLGELEPTNGEKGWSYSADYLATLKPNGAVDKKYGYVSPYWAELAEDATVEGWHLYSNVEDTKFYGERFDNVQLTAGQGFCVYTSAASVELVVPSAIP